jgi:hypothetical protein
MVDRRRFLLIAQGFMLAAAATLGVLALAGLVTPWLLLALIFAVGTARPLPHRPGSHCSPYSSRPPSVSRRSPWAR